MDDSFRDEVLEHRDDAHRVVESIGELSSSAFSEGDLVFGFIVEGEYRCIFIPSTGDGNEMNSSPVGMFRWCCIGVAGWCSPANCDDADAVLIGVERLTCCSPECLIWVLMFVENTNTTIAVVCEDLGLGNVKRVSLSIKDVVADDVCELFGVFHVQTVPTFSDTARIPLMTFYGRPISGWRGTPKGQTPPGEIEGYGPPGFPHWGWQHREPNNHYQKKKNQNY